jgi:hypothetical protein
MKNIDAKVSGTGKNQKLTITINLSERHGVSGSGKSEIVATSGGNQRVEGTDVYLGLNAYVKL